MIIIVPGFSFLGGGGLEILTLHTNDLISDKFLFSILRLRGASSSDSRGTIFWHLLEIARTDTHRQQASFLHNMFLGFPFLSLPCFPN
jgi:hypothetical protein